MMRAVEVRRVGLRVAPSARILPALGSVASALVFFWPLLTGRGLPAWVLGEIVPGTGTARFS